MAEDFEHDDNGSPNPWRELLALVREEHATTLADLLRLTNRIGRHAAHNSGELLSRRHPKR